MQKMKKLARKRKAFTLVEILVVVAIIGILFVAFVPRIDFASTNARETGVKSDFRSFSLAAEQVFRENSGLGFVSNTTEGDGGKSDIVSKLNKYLDDAMQFETTGICKQTDPWNQEYKLYTSAQKAVNNGTLTFVSSGKDASSSLTVASAATDGDDYIITITFTDGIINTWTDGFSSNIKANNVTLP